KARRWLRARQIGYVFLIAPDKHEIYTEEMPPTVRRIGAASRTDQFYDGVRDTGVLVDVRPALMARKGRERIYQKTDRHWNDRGAVVAYRAIIEAARAQVPAIPSPLGPGDFTPETHVVEAMDLAGMMGLKRVLREEDLVLVPKRPRAARVVEPAGE